MQRRAFVALLGGAILSLGCASADAARAEELSAAYRVSYVGLPAGEIRFRFSGDGAAYRDEIAVESSGLARWVTHFRGTAASEGRLADDDHAAPRRYDALYDLRNRRNSHISMRFIGRDGAVIAEREAADTSRKPVLPDRYRRDVVDPIAALAAIRHALLRHPPRDFTVPVYDGARRFDVLVHVVAAGGKEPTIRLLLTLRPIAGFKGEASDEGDPDDAPRPVEAVFTDDANLLPISMRVTVWYLPLVVKFDHFCKSFDACTKGGS
jgi:hypothetical protein